MSTANLITLADENRHQDLFLHELNWNAPDHPPVSVTAAAGETHTVTNVASYRGIRVWACDGIPGSRTEAEIDRAIAKTTTDRLVIFHNEAEQVWRWPARRSTDNANATRLTRHRHRNGNPDPPFESRLAAIQLPLDREIDANTLLTRVRDAFDIEARNESRRASKLMARMYTALERAYPHNADRPKLEHEISVTLARILFLMFGDDTEMWEPDGEPDAFRDFIHRETTPDGATLAEQLNDLFADLNNATVARTVPYINGGLFNEPVTIPPLDREFRDAVLDACAVDWSTISPAIFGSMFQSVRDAQTRRELGEHYTAEDNILKTLNPLFLDELRAEFGTARDHPDAAKLLNKLWKKLGEIRYMDPACGCGNFIIVAYRELRDLELQIMEQLQELGGDNQLSFDPTLSLKVTLDHFHGIEVDEWPARIAETAMFLTNRQCDLKLKQRFGEAPRRLPIQTQTRIVVQSALTLDWETVMPAGVNSIIAGNPPFLGISQRTAQQTAELQAVWGTGYHGTLDYVTGWYAKAVDYFSNHDGLWAFVSTNSVLQGEAVAPLFRRITEHKWRIKFAHRTFPWTSEAAGRAAVHCIIIGFAKKVAEPRLFDYPSAGAAPVERAGVTNITPYLTDGPYVLVEPVTNPLNPQIGAVAYGNKPTDGGNLIVEPDAYQTVMDDPIAAKYVRRYVGARELLHDTMRHCLWLRDADDEDLERSPVLKERVAAARQFRSKSRAASTRDAASTAHEFRQVSQPDAAYLCIPRHISENYPYFLAQRYGADVICSDANFLSPDPDGFIFAAISSTMFMTWQRTVGGRIKSDLRFNKLLAWNTFPLPTINDDRRKLIISAGAEVLTVRAQLTNMALADMYDPVSFPEDLRQAHLRLDHIVDEVFGVKDPDIPELDRQDVLFSHYRRLTKRL